MLVDFVAGSKLDFYIIAPVLEAVQAEQDKGRDVGYRVIYTGDSEEFRTIDSELSFFGIPRPNIFLEVKDDSSATQTAQTLVRYEQVLKSAKPDIVMLFGHSTGAMACTLAAAKIPGLKIAHIGSGMRSNNRNAADEVNRKVIDAITDYHFPIAQSSGENLRMEGVPDDFIFFVGNPIADFLNKEIETMPVPEIWDRLQLQPRKYFLLNLEHPSIAKSTARFKALLLNIIRLSRNLPIILPTNSTSAKTLKAIGLRARNLHVIENPGISTLYYLSRHAKAVITDTENLQDETTVLQTPCMTLFKTVARPDTNTTGYNEITGLQPEAIEDAFQKLFSGEWKKGRIPYLWDGKAATRILNVLKKLI